MPKQYDTNLLDYMHKPTEPSTVAHYRCIVCGYETTKPRDGHLLGFSSPLICEDFCCDGLVTSCSYDSHNVKST